MRLSHTLASSIGIVALAAFEGQLPGRSYNPRLGAFNYSPGDLRF